MLVLGTSSTNIPILAFSSGSKIGVAERQIIDWSSLKLVAYECKSSNTKSILLLTQDIREFGAQFLLVNSDDDLVEADEIIRLKPIMAKNFKLIGAKVVTESATNLGHVMDYTFETKSFMVEKIHVKRPLYKSLLADNLLIDRDQIIEVNPPVIVVRDNWAKEPIGAVAPVITE